MAHVTEILAKNNDQTLNFSFIHKNSLTILERVKVNCCQMYGMIILIK